MEQVRLVAFGNPMLDMNVIVSDHSLHHKYSLELDGQILVSSETLQSIKNDVSRNDVSYSPGGSSQNTLRIFQWLASQKFVTAIFGSVGCDCESLMLENELRTEGVITKYTKIKEETTGSVCVLVYNSNRSAVACLGAAAIYTIDHLTKESINTLDKCEILHVEGFFAHHSPEVVLKLFGISKEKSIITSFNICSPYVVRDNPNLIVNLCSACDILIGNSKEFSELFRNIELKEVDVKDRLSSLHKMMLKIGCKNKASLPIMEKWKKVLIMTDDERPVHVVYGDGCYETQQVPKVDGIIDTTGAGDSFLAAFLYSLMLGKPIEQCIRAGINVSGHIIKQRGCSIPHEDPKALLY